MGTTSIRSQGSINPATTAAIYLELEWSLENGEWNTPTKCNYFPIRGR